MSQENNRFKDTIKGLTRRSIGIELEVEEELSQQMGALVSPSKPPAPKKPKKGGEGGSSSQAIELSQ